MSLGAHFARHLRDPRGGDPSGFASELAAAGLELEARCYIAWASREASLPGEGARLAISAVPPSDATLGDRWFDPCELTVMLHVGRAWLATRPTARWQMCGMLEASTRVSREVQVEPPYQPLDPSRLTPPGSDETARCTGLTAGEATLYAWFFRKVLPHRYDWQAAKEQLAESSFGQLWQQSAMEWVSGHHESDEGTRLVITPQTLRSEPEDDDRVVRGEHTHNAEIGFRTSVLIQLGLLETVTSWHILPEPVRLVALVDRPAFA